MKTSTKGTMIAVGLAVFVSAGAMTPSVAAPLASSAAALGAAALNDVTQVRYSRRGWRGDYGSYGRAFNYGGNGHGGGWSNNSPAATGGGSLGYNRGIYAN